MSYNRKTWTNRNSEHPYRRTLTDTTSGTSQTVDVTRAEGTITAEGDTFDANTMNNMEGRIADEFSLVNQKIGDLNDLDTQDKSSLVDAINEVAAGGGGGGGTGARYVKISFSSTEPAPSSTARMLYVGTVDHNGTSIAVSQVASLVRSGYEAYLVVAYSNQTIIYPYDGICHVGNDDWLSFEMSNYYQHIRLAVDIDVNNNTMTALVKTKYDAEEITYDNTTSGLSATDVKSAIDELSSNQSTPDADDVQYDNTNSGLTATDAQAAIDELASEKADIASPAFTGSPTAPTQSAGDDSTKIATTAFVQTSHEYQKGETISIAGMLCPFWQTATSLRIFIPLTKIVNSGVSTSSITQTGNFEIRSYNGTAIASGHPLSDYGTVTFYRLAGGIGVLVSNLNSTWGDTSRYTTGFAYANSGNTIQLGSAS